MIYIKKVESIYEKELMLYLARYKETTMFLRNNLYYSGLNFKPTPFHGEYYLSFDKSDNINGVLAHYWSGNVMMQADDLLILQTLVNEFKLHKTRPIAGVLGEDSQANFTIHQLNLKHLPFALNVQEQLFSLKLEQMTLPKLDESINCVIKHLTDSDQNLIKKWLISYHIEALGAQENDLTLEKHIIQELQDTQINQNRWVLFVNDVPVSLFGFNARLPDMVQIGPVYTPPEYRNRGYARLGLSMGLVQAKKEEVTHAILFTNTPPAIRSYRSLGFQVVGNYRLAILKAP